MCSLVFNNRLKRIPLKFWTSFSAKLPPLVFCPVNLNGSVFLKSKLCLLNLVRWLCYVWIPFPYTKIWKLCPLENWGNHITYLICFPFLRGHISVLPCCSVSERRFFISFALFLVVDSKGKSSPVTLSWLDVKGP